MTKWHDIALRVLAAALLALAGALTERLQPGALSGPVVQAAHVALAEVLPGLK